MTERTVKICLCIAYDVFLTTSFILKIITIYFFYCTTRGLGIIFFFWNSQNNIFEKYFLFDQKTIKKFCVSWVVLNKYIYFLVDNSGFSFTPGVKKITIFLNYLQVLWWVAPKNIVITRERGRVLSVTRDTKNRRRTAHFLEAKVKVFKKENILWFHPNKTKDINESVES